MQDVTPWPESFDVSEPVARVLVDGQEVSVESVSVTSELDSAMPDRVAAGGGGVVAATGTASILRADDIAEAGFNPWGDAQAFVNASEIVVEAGYHDPATGGVGCARQITGQMESLDGGAKANSVGLEFADYTPLLDRDITIEPLLREYPQLNEGWNRRGAGLYPTYITDRVLRHCGFYATPPMVEGAILSAPMMGSAVPERGTLLSARAHSSSSLPSVFQPVPWGMGLTNGAMRYIPDFGVRGHGRLTSTLHVSFHRHSLRGTPQGDGQIFLGWSSDDGIRVSMRVSGAIYILYQQNGVSTVILTMSGANVAASEAFTVLVSPDGRVTLYASNGAVAQGDVVLPSQFSSQDLELIYVRVPQFSHVLGGVQVAFSESANHLVKRTAHIDPPVSSHALRAFPAKVKVNCLALLKEQAEAELAAMWVDEFGHFQWRNRNRLQDSASVGTLTSKQDLYDFPWQVPVRSVFSRIELSYEAPTITIRDVPSVTVSDGRGSTLVNGDTDDRFFEPPADQDWHQVAPPSRVVSFPPDDLWILRRGRGSYSGGVLFRGEEDESGENARWENFEQHWAQIHPQRWLLSSVVSGLSSDEYIEQTFRDRPELYGRFSGENLPIIRAQGLTEWSQETVTGKDLGPSLAPVFVHNVGPWIQDPDELETLANWLTDNLTESGVVLRNLPIVPDPRIQLGDVFWLEDQSAYHVRLRVVVMGKTLQYQANNSKHEMSQNITCRVLSVNRLEVRYDELETAWQGRDYGALESAWTGQDYNDFETDPLDRS